MKKINLETIKNILRKKERDPAQVLISPHRDWAILLLLAVLLMVGIVVSSMMYFSKVSGTDGFLTAEQNKLKAEFIDKKKLEHVLESYDQKNALFEKLQEESPFFIDPSL